MTRLDQPHLRRVMQRASWSHAILVSIAFEHLRDERITHDEALEMAAIALLLAAVRREAQRLADETDQAANAVTVVSRMTAIQQAGQIIREVAPETLLVLPPVADGVRQLLAGITVRRSVLATFADDAVAMFAELLGVNLVTQPLHAAPRLAIGRMFGAGLADMGILTRRSVIIVRQSNYDTYRPVMTEMYRLNADWAFWEWRSSLDGRVCPACVALHGRIFPVSQAFRHAHIGCRCLPMMRRTDRPSGQTGEEWLRDQPEARQTAILGKRGAELFRQGEIGIADFLRLRRHPVYGSTWTNGGVGYAEQRAARRNERVNA